MQVNQFMNKENTVRLLLILSFFIPFALCFPLWFSKRIYPVTPFLIQDVSFNRTIDIIILLVFAGVSLWFLLKKKGYGGIVFFTLYAMLAIIDQTRIQPFFIEIAVIIFFYGLFRKDFEKFKLAFLLLMAGTYIWSGLHKANPTFFEFWSNGLSKRIPFVPETLRTIFTYMVPFMEMSFGVMLLFNKTRKLGIILLAIMHFMVLVTLTMAGVGFTVFPLNMVNVILLFMLCFKMNWNIGDLFKNRNLKLKLVLVYALVLPVLNLFGWNDHLLSFSFFSGKPEYCNIYLNDAKSLDNLPEDLKSLMRSNQGQYYINVNEWSLTSVKVLAYPENRVYNYLQQHIETFTGENTTQIQLYK